MISLLRENMSADLHVTHPLSHYLFRFPSRPIVSFRFLLLCKNSRFVKVSQTRPRRFLQAFLGWSPGSMNFRLANLLVEGHFLPNAWIENYYSFLMIRVQRFWNIV